MDLRDNLKNTSERQDAADSLGSAVVAPQTPASTHMDSDDDINSVASSGDFNLEDEDQNSDLSLDGGTAIYCLICPLHH